METDLRQNQWKLMLATIADYAIVDGIDGEHLVDMYVVVHSTIESISVGEGL